MWLEKGLASRGGLDMALVMPRNIIRDKQSALVKISIYSARN